jgi:predicted GH43/DUF377 family glycosyl hydrolase
VVRDGERLLIYFGAADAVTAVAEFSERAILDAMTVPGWATRNLTPGSGR